MATAPLNETGVIQLDESGNGTAKVGPTGSGEIWNIAYVHVQTNQVPGTVVNEAQCIAYAGPQSTSQYFIDSTTWGSTGDTTDAASAYPLSKNNYVWAVWSGGDANVEGIVRVTGTKEI